MFYPAKRSSPLERNRWLPVGRVHLASPDKGNMGTIPIHSPRGHQEQRQDGKRNPMANISHIPQPETMKASDKSPESGCATALLGSVLHRCLCRCFSHPAALVLQVASAFPTLLLPPFSSAQLAQAQLSYCQWGSPQLDLGSSPSLWQGLHWLCWFSPAVDERWCHCPFSTVSCSCVLEKTQWGAGVLMEAGSAGADADTFCWRERGKMVPTCEGCAHFHPIYDVDDIE